MFTLLLRVIQSESLHSRRLNPGATNHIFGRAMISGESLFQERKSSSALVVNFRRKYRMVPARSPWGLREWGPIPRLCNFCKSFGILHFTQSSAIYRFLTADNRVIMRAKLRQYRPGVSTVYKKYERGARGNRASGIVFCLFSWYLPLSAKMQRVFTRKVRFDD